MERELGNAELVAAALDIDLDAIEIVSQPTAVTRTVLGCPDNTVRKELDGDSFFCEATTSWLRARFVRRGAVVLLAAVVCLKSSKSKAEETKRAEHERDKRTLAAEEDRARRSGTAGNARAAPRMLLTRRLPEAGETVCRTTERKEGAAEGSREEELARPRVLRGLAGMARREDERSFFRGSAADCL